MSRDALPPVPDVIGTPAEYTHATFARRWEERRVAWTQPTLPPPIVRAHEMNVEADGLPRNARKIARLGIRKGFSVRITRAVGYDMNSDGSQATKDIMEETGEMTPGGKKTPPRPATQKVGEELRPAVVSIRVLILTPDGKRMVGHWLDGGWDFGLILDGRILVQNCNWTGLEEAVNAESEADVREQDAGGGQLSLFGDVRPTV